MKFLSLSVIAMLATAPFVSAGVSIDQQAFGSSLGGWTKRGNQVAEYPLSGAVYRTYKPEITPTPDGGIFVSLRIDHVRGWLSSDDHAVLEVTVSAKGNLESAQSTIAIQGRSITTDLIRSGTGVGQKLVGVDRAVQIGTDLVADLTSKMLLEKIVEPGRVSYPAVLRHNYNLLYQAIRTEAPPPVALPVDGDKPEAGQAKPPSGAEPVPATGGKPADPVTPEPPSKPAAKLEIKSAGEVPKMEIKSAGEAPKNEPPANK
jgi:hypothetical protein